MASLRVLPDTVELFNYTGESERGEAQYQKTILRHCFCPLEEGVTAKGQGKTPSDRADLYVFDRRTIAEDEAGAARKFMVFEEWEKLGDKSAFWTFSDKGRDYFRRQGRDERLKVVSFRHLVAGTPRMWHFEVKAE